MHRNISISRGDSTITFGDKFIITDLDLGTHPITYQTVDKSVGVEYISGKIGDRKLTIKGYIVCHRTVNEDGSVNLATQEMSEAKSLLLDICSLTEPFTLEVEGLQSLCHLKSSVEWTQDYKNCSDQIAKFIITAVSSYSDYHSKVFYDPNQDKWLYAVYSTAGTILATQTFAEPLRGTFKDPATDTEITGIYGIKVHHFESTNAQFDISLSRVQDPIPNTIHYCPIPYIHKDVYCFPSQRLEFVRFSGNLEYTTAEGNYPYTIEEVTKGTFAWRRTETHSPERRLSYTTELNQPMTINDRRSTAVTSPRITMVSPPEGEYHNYGFVQFPDLMYYAEDGYTQITLDDRIPAIVPEATDIVINMIV